MKKIMRLHNCGNGSTKVRSEISNRASSAENEAENEAENQAEKKKLSLSWKGIGEIA
jgi:hypothetical protein